MDIITLALAVLSGGLVGFSLGLIGGGGSILATPLLLYVVGVSDPHMAIGTSALAVAGSAAVNLIGHAKGGHIRWRPALMFAACGIIGAFAGSTLGKHFPGEHLLFLFALLMIFVAARMLRASKRPQTVEKTFRIPVLVAIGVGVGMLSGFFGIGGGFLIVPGLIAATGMPMLAAVASSLVSVASFGLTTALNYAWSGLVAWPVAALFVAGGFIGGRFGRRLAARLSLRHGALHKVFAVMVALVAVYMLVEQWNILFTPAAVAVH